MSKKDVLLVVDLQQEFKDKDGGYDELLHYVRCAGPKYDAIIGTICLNTPDNNFVRYGNWTDCMGSFLGLEYTPDLIIVKHGYGLDDYNILDKNNHYYIMGMNTDACVLKVALDLFDRGYEFTVLGDYCASNGGLGHHIRGISLMQTLFPEAIVSTKAFSGYNRTVSYIPKGVTVKTPEMERWFDDSKAKKKQVDKKETTHKNKSNKQKNNVEKTERKYLDDKTIADVADLVSKLFGVPVTYKDGAFVADGLTILPITNMPNIDEEEQIDFGAEFKKNCDMQALKDLFTE